MEPAHSEVVSRWLVVFAIGCSGTLTKVPKERKGAELVDCSDGYSRPILDAVAAVATGVATAYGFKSGTFEDCEAIGCLILPYGVVATIALPLVATYGFDVVHTCRETKVRVARERADEEAAVQRASLRDNAWQLTKHAAAAARAGDCATVRDTSAIVRRDDEDFHRTVFVKDVAIARCLAE